MAQGSSKGNTVLNLPMTVANGGTGIATNTAYAVICGGTTAGGVYQSVAGVGTSGQVLTSNGAASLPTFQDAGGGGGWTWTATASETQAMAVDNAYIDNNGSLTTFTLPTTAAVDERVKVVGYETGFWKIAQNADELIYLNGDVTTTGTGGSITSTGRGNSITLVCVVANTEWVAETVQGSLTIV